MPLLHFPCPRTGRSATRLRARTVVARTALLGGLVALAAAPAARADLPTGTFVFNGPITAMKQAGGYTYVGGSFTAEQPTTGSGLLLPTSGSGQPDPASFPHVAGTVDAVAADGAGGWYVGGTFRKVGGLYARNLAHVTAAGAVDPGFKAYPDRQVAAIAVTGSHLFVAGGFSTIGGAFRSHLADLDPTSGASKAWDPGAGWNPNSQNVPTALATDGTHMWVGLANYALTQGQTRTGVVGFDVASGVEQSKYARQTTGDVEALMASSGELYFAGGFGAVDGASHPLVASMDAASGAMSSWSPPLTSDQGDVMGMAQAGDSLYLGGTFRSLDGKPRLGAGAVSVSSGAVLDWDPQVDGDGSGDGWPVVRSVATDGTRVFLGGNFSSAGGEDRHDLASADGVSAAVTSWNPNPAGVVRAVAASSGSLYAGGDGVSAGTPLATISHLARLTSDGALDTSWHPVVTDQGDSPIISAMLSAGGKLFIAGSFDTFAGQHRGGIAAIDPAAGSLLSWDAGLGHAGTRSWVRSIGATSSALYLGGFFSSAAGATRNDLAAADIGTGQLLAWNPQIDASGTLDNGINSLVVNGNTVVFAGFFTSVGGTTQRAVAAVNATSGALLPWTIAPSPPYSPLSNGQSVHLAAVGGLIVAGGGGVGRIVVDAATGAPSTWGASNTRGLDFIDDSYSNGDTLYAVGGFVDELYNQVDVVDPATGAVTGSGVRTTGYDETFGPTIVGIDPDGDGLEIAGNFQFANDEPTGPFARVPKTAPVSDDAAPSVTVTTPSDGAHVTVGTTVATSFSCSDPSGVDACSGPSSLDTSATGPHTFTVTAADKLGNLRRTTVGYTVDALDTTPPIVTIQDPVEGTVVDQGVHYATSFECGDPGGVDRPTCDGPAFLDTAQVGPHTFSVTSRDAAGNVTSKTVNYVVAAPDTTPPTVTVTLPAQGQHFAQGAIVHPQYSCDDGAGRGVDACIGDPLLDTDEVGPHDYVVRTSDLAGNETSVTVSYVVDVVPSATPAATPDAPPPSPTPTLAGQTAPAAPVPAVTPTPVPKPLSVQAGRLVINAVQLARTKKTSKCPKSVTVTVTAGKAKGSGKVPLKTSGASCTASGSVKLSPKLAQATSMSVVLTGTGLKPTKVRLLVAG